MPHHRVNCRRPGTLEIDEGAVFIEQDGTNGSGIHGIRLFLKALCGRRAFLSWLRDRGQ
jgi:hypothetical protein